MATDLELATRQAEATVARLEAEIRQNADISVESTSLEQALKFVESMRSTVAAALARTESGKAQLEYALRSYGRVERLFRQGTTTQDEFDQALVQRTRADVDYRQDELVHAAMVAMQAATSLMPTMVRQYIERKKLNEAVLRQQKAEAEAHLDAVRLNQTRGTLTSPVDGVVLKRYTTSEGFLAAGASLLELGRLDDMEVEADILTLDAVTARVGGRVEIYGPAIGTPRASGVVRRIYPAGFTKVSSLGVEQQRVKVIVGFEPGQLPRLLTERELGVGYRVRVRIFTAEKANVLTLPRSSLFRSPDGT